MNHLKVSNPDDLLANQQYPKMIEAQLVNYIMSLRESGISYSTIKVLIAPICTYYDLNDVVINRRKIAKYLPEMTRTVRDEAYTTEQIQQALQNADQRMRMIILLLASTGCRIGALPGLVLRDLTKIPKYDIYRITFYQGTRNEYYNFTTKEASSTGIDNYLLYRKRCGEKLSFNENLNRWEPDNAPLIRTRFDINDALQARSPQPMKLNGLRMALTYHLIKSGLRQFEHKLENSNCKRIRKPVSLSNGYRKHVISTFIEAGLNHEIRELIVDHATHLDANYLRPSEDHVLQEYLKAEPYLTIDLAARLARENQTLKINMNSLEALRVEVENLKRVLNQ
jgi:integrase